MNEIEEFLKNINITKYTINEDLSVDCHQSVDISDSGLSNIPIKFNYINGFFDCSGNNLTDLSNCPTETKGFFDCSNNNLTTLGGGPKKVGSFFNCHFNSLTSLFTCPKFIDGDFDFRFNKLENNWFESVVTGDIYTNLKDDTIVIDNHGQIKNKKEWLVLNNRISIIDKVVKLSN